MGALLLIGLGQGKLRAQELGVPSQLHAYATYNRWANEQLLQWLEKASDAQRKMPMVSSFSTLDSTLMHLWQAEYGWFQTLRNQPWAQPDVQSIATFSERAVAFRAISDSLVALTARLSAAELAETRPLGRNGQQVSLADILLHVFNHATYHRGQLITMGRQAGLAEPPRTDYIFFVLQQGP